jgi:polysaccharide export outer membrane protein
MRALISALSLVVSLVGLPGCSQPAADVGNVPAAASAIVASPANPILAPTELIEIKVFQEPDLSTVARIRDDGRMNMPLIGEVAVGGKTVPEATRLIREGLEAKFLVKPQVTVTIVEHARKLFTILGQVQRSGTYKFPDRESLNLIQAIGIAGGYTALADPSRITLKRLVNGRQSVLKVDAKRMAKDASAPTEIQSGDIITVGERLF